MITVSFATEEIVMKFAFYLQNGTKVDALPGGYDKFYIAEDLETSSELIAWFCGHWHINKRIDDIHFLFHQFESSGAIQEIAMARRFSK